MTRVWTDLLVDRGALDQLYSTVPELARVTLRSVHLGRLGPSIILRLDLERFPDRPPPRWRDSQLDTLQLHVRFLGVADLVMSGSDLPVVAAIEMEPIGDRRLDVEVRSATAPLRFTSSDALAVGHVSAYRKQNRLDAGSHRYAGRVDERLYSVVPPSFVERFHDRL